MGSVAPSQPSARKIEFTDDTFVVDATFLGELLNLPASQVPTLMRDGVITSICERGMDVHEGQFRLTFFHGNRRARVSTDQTGKILRKSVVITNSPPAGSR